MTCFISYDSLKVISILLLDRENSNCHHDIALKNVSVHFLACKDSDFSIVSSSLKMTFGDSAAVITTAPIYDQMLKAAFRNNSSSSNNNNNNNNSSNNNGNSNSNNKTNSNNNSDLWSDVESSSSQKQQQQQ